MAIVYRLVKGSRLTKLEFDNNFHDVDDRVAVLEATVVANPIISEFRVVGDQFFVDFDDYTSLGPYDLPVVMPNPRGEWTAATSYSQFDWIYFEGALYAVLFSHTSAGSFDPNAVSGLNPLYELIMPAPDANAPAVETASSSAFQFSLSLANKYVRCTHVSGATITIELDATINHTIATEATFVHRGGPLIFEAGVGVTLNWPDGYLPETTVVGAWVIIKKYAANAWDLTGGPLALDPSS